MNETNEDIKSQNLHLSSEQQLITLANVQEIYESTFLWNLEQNLYQLCCFRTILFQISILEHSSCQMQFGTDFVPNFHFGTTLARFHNSHNGTKQGPLRTALIRDEKHDSKIIMDIIYPYLDVCADIDGNQLSK